MHPQLIIKGFRKACALAKSKIREIAVSIDAKTVEERRVLLERCAATSLSSKLVAGQSAFFSKMIVDAVEKATEVYLSQRTEGEPECSPDAPAACDFNRQDWAALLQLNATAPRVAPPPPAPAAPTSVPLQPVTEPGSDR